MDGLDIARMGLTDLRTKLTIIPREYPWADSETILSVTFRGPNNFEWNFAVNS